MLREAVKGLLGGPVAKTWSLNAVPFLVGNLGPNIPHSQKTSTETAEVMVFSNHVTNSLKT